MNSPVSRNVSCAAIAIKSVCSRPLVCLMMIACRSLLWCKQGTGALSLQHCTTLCKVCCLALCRLGRLRGEAIAERVGFQSGGFALGPSMAHAQVQTPLSPQDGHNGPHV